MKKDEDTYINISSNQKVNTKIKQVTGKTNLDALFLTKKEIDNLFTKTILIDSDS